MLAVVGALQYRLTVRCLTAGIDQRNNIFNLIHQDYLSADQPGEPAVLQRLQVIVQWTALPSCEEADTDNACQP